MTTFACLCHWCGATLIRKTQSVKVQFHFCDKSCKGAYQKTFKPVTRDWLHEHYIEKQMDTTQIGHLVRRDPKSVWNWLKDFQIPTRPRGGNITVLIAKSQEHNWWKGRKHTAATRKKLSAIAKADGRVPFDKSIGPPMRGKKGADTVNWKGGITPERQAFYFSAEWKRAAAIAWKRDRGTCQRCGVNKYDAEHALHLHHVVPFTYRPLRAEPTNLILLCKPCHSWVHSAKNKNKKFIQGAPTS